MPAKRSIELIEPGTRWPSGDGRPLAQLAVDDAWVAGVVGGPLASGVEGGLGPWVGVGGRLPSGTFVEFLRHDLGGPLYALYVDADADPRAALAELLAVTGLDDGAVHWRHPEA